MTIVVPGGGSGGGAVSSVAAADASMNIPTTTGAVTVSRAAITGDVAIGAGSNAAVLQPTSGVSGLMRNVNESATAVATTNIASLTTGGTPAVDGVTLAAGDLVLLTAQSTASQNGLWGIPSSGAWFRPFSFASGTSYPGFLVGVVNGTTNANTIWQLDATGSAGVIVDTTAQTWTKITSGGGGAVSSVSNADGTLAISPTTGAVVGSLSAAQAAQSRLALASDGGNR